MTSKSRGHCDNIKVFNQGKSNQIREKSGNLIAKNVWPPCLDYQLVTFYRYLPVYFPNEKVPWQMSVPMLLYKGCRDCHHSA